MMKTNNSTGLPSSVMGMGRKEKKKVIVVLLITIISLLTIGFIQFDKNRSIEAPSYKAGNEIVQSTEEKRKDYLKELIDNKVNQLKKDGYENISYSKKEDLIENSNYLNLGKIEDLDKYILDKYIFYTEYKVVTVDKKDYYFKSSNEVNAFIKKLKKYENKTYKIRNVKEQIGKETSKNTIDEIILSKRIIAEKAEAERQAKLKAQAAKKQSQSAAAAKNKTTSNKSSNSNKKSTTTTKVTITNTNVTGTAIANFAKQFVGNPYVRGGTSLTKGADCSGFVQSVYKHFGISIPRTASQQARVGKTVAWKDLQPGDLVFYSGNGGKSVTHVALYIGNGKIVHAQTPALGIGITTANIMVKMGARRII